MKLRNKIFIIVMALLLVFAILLIAIGYACIGLNIFEWLSSRWAFWIYTAIGIYGLASISLIVWDKIKKL